MLSTQQSFAIGIPTINQWEVLQPSIEKYLVNFPLTDIYIVDNGRQQIQVKHLNVHVIKNPSPKSVAASWNQLCRMIFYAHRYALILNDDVFLNRKEHEIENIVRLHGTADFVLAGSGFHSFIMPKNTFHGPVGTFDENFKGAYFEDNDYMRRLELYNSNSIHRSSFLNPEVLGESMSIKKDPSLNKNFQANHEYYVKKWGGNRGGETFTKPFNEK